MAGSCFRFILATVATRFFHSISLLPTNDLTKDTLSSVMLSTYVSFASLLRAMLYKSGYEIFKDDWRYNGPVRFAEKTSQNIVPADLL